MSDPTNTGGIRRSFLAEANRRLARLRSQTHGILVEHDLMAARSNPLAQMLGEPGQRLPMFAQWFERAVNEQLTGGWWEKFLERAQESGAVAGSELVGSPRLGRRPVPAVYRELARREFAGIAAAMVAQITRVAAVSLAARRKPLPLYQQVLPVLRKVGHLRIKAAVNTLTVQIHNAARLTHFSEAGVTRVGIVPELLEPPRPSRFGAPRVVKHDHLVHDDSYILQARLALEAAQEEVRQAAARTAQAELEAAQAQARAEVAQARAETAQGEAETTAQEAAQGGWTEAQQQYRNAKAEAAAAAAATAQSAAEQAREEAAQAEAAAEQARQDEAQARAALEAMPSLFAVLTAGDEKVCQICLDLAADGPYTIDEAWPLLPAHPNCRCAWIPAGEATGEE